MTPGSNHRSFPWHRLDLSIHRYPDRRVFGTDNGETSGKTVVFTVSGDGEPSFLRPKSILEFLRTEHDCVVAVDATLFSYEGEKRSLAIQEAAMNGISLLCKQTRHEARLRSELDIDKCEDNDAQLCYYIAQHTKYELSKLRELPDPILRMGETAPAAPGTRILDTWQSFFNYKRRSGTQLRKDWVQEFLADVPTFRDLHPRYAKPLSNSSGTNYDTNLMLLAVAVARDARILAHSSREFSRLLDRLWGWYGTGHRSYPRSTFYRRAVTLAQRECRPGKLSDIAWKKYDTWAGDMKLRRSILKEQQTSLRKAIKHLSPWEVQAHHSLETGTTLPVLPS